MRMNGWPRGGRFVRLGATFIHWKDLGVVWLVYPNYLADRFDKR
jgi:hypothetical protein